jgi:transcriptional regulator with XRE-family HTH domain
MKKEKSEETINERVKYLRESLNLTQQEFAEMLGHKTSNTISMIEKGKNNLTEYNIRSICEKILFKGNCPVNPDWLRTGKGKMFEDADENPRLIEEGKGRIPPDEEELVGIYRKLTRPNKRVAIKQVDVLLEGQGDEKGEIGKNQKAERKSG